MTLNSNTYVSVKNSKVAVPPLGPAPWRPLPFVTFSTDKNLPCLSLDVFVASSFGNAAPNGVPHGFSSGRHLAADNLTYRSIATVKLERPHQIACQMRKIRLTAHDKEFAQ
jgi:hypothetical protein